ncbi:unnamed protein product [Dovyalis caffra]|uniref:Uncharacterized protein n=1 Tax=Dovyalis caffra TaxID=77055 RepID=A0AAV1QQX0_9ROSI|nr:unnamed protein product [Dovyalis caffra]
MGVSGREGARLVTTLLPSRHSSLVHGNPLCRVHSPGLGPKLAPPDFNNYDLARRPRLRGGRTARPNSKDFDQWALERGANMQKASFRVFSGKSTGMTTREDRKRPKECRSIEKSKHIETRGKERPG